MKRISLALLALAALCCVSCRKQDIRTAVLEVPGMKNQSCADRIVKAVATELAAGPADDATPQRIQAVVLSGAIKTDLDRKVVTVTYDSLRLSLKNLEFAAAKAGFAANNTPADPEAVKALPPDCR
jgi:copper chaperone CopZ